MNDEIVASAERQSESETKDPSEYFIEKGEEIMRDLRSEELLQSRVWIGEMTLGSWVHDTDM